MNEKKKSILIRTGIAIGCIVGGAVLLAVFLNSKDTVKEAFSDFFGALMPIIYGVIFTFVMAPVFNFLRDKLAKNMNIKAAKAIAASISLVILICAIAVLFLMIAPQLIETVQHMLKNLPEYFKKASDISASIAKKFPGLKIEKAGSSGDALGAVTKWVNDEILPNLSTYVTSIGSGVWGIIVGFKDFIVGMIFMMYLILYKDKLQAQWRKIIYSNNEINKANRIIEDWEYVKNVFLKFISGSIVDSFIVGVVSFVAFSLFRIPYSLLFACFIALTNIIPFYGPFIGTIPCAFILLFISPIQCLEFVLINLVLQQIDGNIISTKVFGIATGLPTFWVQLSIIAMGGLFGIGGMILAVPTFAVIYYFCKRKVNEDLAERELKIETAEYIDLEKIDSETHEYIKREKKS